MSPIRPVLTAAFAAAVLVSGCGGGTHPSTSATTSTTAQAAAPSPTGGSTNELQADYIRAVNRVRPSVVEISTGSALGSGVVFDRAGHIVTNAHVVGDATTFEVTLSDGRALPATLVGAYAPDDLAVIRISGASLPDPATFADSSLVPVGQIVLAVGNPLGLASSVTDGIVSFNGRTVSEGNGVVLPATIQISAPINPGNSGGALVNLNGEVIGIPTLAASDTQGGGTAPGIGFAIPSNTVKLIAGQLAATGTVTSTGRAALGIQGATQVDAAGQPSGVVVVTVTPGGAADQAGIRPGDVITALNGHPTETVAALLDVLSTLKPGDTATVTVTTDGAQRTVTVTVQQLKAG